MSNVSFQQGNNATPPSGTIIATDQISSVDYQVVKVAWGAVGAVNQTSAANPLPVTFSGTVTVNGSGFTQPVSGTVTANAGTGTFTVSNSALQLAQASTTSGQTGPLIQGAVTTAAPVYTTGQTDPLSLTTAGALRVDASATTQPVSGTITANAGSGTFTVGGTVTANAGTGTFGVSGTVTANAGTGTFTVSDTALELAQASTTSGQKGPLLQGAVTTAAPSYTTAQTNPLSLTTAGALRVDNSAVTQPVSGTVTANQGGTWTVQPGNTANTTPWLVTQIPATSGGLTIFRLLSAATTNSNNIKASAGQVFGWAITNTNAAARFVKLYNKATAPTVGTDTPVMTLVIPGNTAGAGMVAANFNSGIAFATGIGIGITGVVTDADTTAVAANEVVVNLFYK